MDLLLICLAGFFILLGIVGSFLPIIPGPMTSWIGLFTLSFVSYVSISTSFLVISLSIALLIFLLDIFLDYNLHAFRNLSRLFYKFHHDIFYKNYMIDSVFGDFQMVHVKYKLIFFFLVLILQLKSLKSHQLDMMCYK